MNPWSTSVVPEIGTLRSVGAGVGSSLLVTWLCVAMCISTAILVYRSVPWEGPNELMLGARAHCQRELKPMRKVGPMPHLAGAGRVIRSCNDLRRSGDAEAFPTLQSVAGCRARTEDMTSSSAKCSATRRWMCGDSDGMCSRRPSMSVSGVTAVPAVIEPEGPAVP